MTICTTMSRRTVLSAAATIPALGIATAARSSAIRSSGRAEWDHAFAIMQRAVSEDAAYDPVYMKAFQAFCADAPDPDAVECRQAMYHPHYQAWLAKDLDEYERAWLAERGRSWSGAEFEQLGRRQIDQVREYRRMRAIAEKRHNMPAIEAEWERLGELAYAARWALFNIPAPDLVALRWKAEHLFGECVAHGNECPSWNEDIIAGYMADVRRLLVAEASA